jgi:DNA-binding MarR family transcriptional regulator
MEGSDFNLDYQNRNLDSRIVAALERVAQAFKTLLWQEGKEYSLSPIQIQLLIFLLFHPGEKCKISYLAGEFNLTKATISEAIKALEQKKLIRKVPETADTRSYTIILTDAGQETAEKVSYFSKSMLAPLMKMSVEEKGKFLYQLMQIIRHLHDTGIITIQRMCFNCVHYRSIELTKTHFCALLKQPLREDQLRIDCPEHVLV